MATSPLRRSPLTAATVTPPSIDRQHKYHAQTATDSSKRSSSASSASSTSTTAAPTSPSPSASPTMAAATTSSTASMVLASVVSLVDSRRRKSAHAASATAPQTLPSHPSDAMAAADRRVSWDACRRDRDGYVSFPDFDQLRALERERRAAKD